LLDVAGSWAAADAEGRSDGTLGTDKGCQSEKEYGSGEGLGQHLNDEWMEVRRMVAGQKEIDCVERVLECETESGDEYCK